MNLLSSKAPVLRKFSIILIVLAFQLVQRPAFGDEILLKEIRKYADREISDEEKFLLLKAYFYQSLNDATYVEKLRQLQGELPQELAARPDIQMYVAAVKLIEAEQTMWPVKKVNLVNEALKDMDDALKSSPDNFELQMIHASCSHDVPALFGRKESSRLILESLFKRFDKEGSSYPDFLRVEWLGYFIENEVAPELDKSRALYVQLGGHLSDLE